MPMGFSGGSEACGGARGFDVYWLYEQLNWSIDMCEIMGESIFLDN